MGCHTIYRGKSIQSHEVNQAVDYLKKTYSGKFPEFIPDGILASISESTDKSCTVISNSTATLAQY